MAKNQNKVGESKSQVVCELPLACADETAAMEFVEELRWGNEACCPRCSSKDVYAVKDRETGARNKDYRWRCRGCGEFFTARTGTVMEDSRIPMRHWCWAFWQLCSSKKGISAMQIRRQTGVSYKSALFLLHRVRFAMADLQGITLTGIVECDETYVGGKPRKGTGKHRRGRGTPKTPVFAAVQRGGKIRRRVVTDVTAKSLKGAIREMVDANAKVITDEFQAYNGLIREFGGHWMVNHGAGEYARGDVHTNTAESSFALVKRGIYGVYHNVSKKHLHRYLAEFDFRWNNREVDDGQRTVNAILAAQGKRLMYREPEERSAQDDLCN